MKFQEIIPALIQGIPIRNEQISLFLLRDNDIRQIYIPTKTKLKGAFMYDEVTSNEWETFTLEDFKREVYKAIEEMPEEYRKGQKVFNYIDAYYYGYARIIQFKKHIDCFYDDSAIEEFIEECYNTIINTTGNE